MIQRYSPDSVYHVRTGTVTNVDLVPDVDGEAVLFEDHIAAVTGLVRALRNIRKSHIACEIIASEFFEEGFADHRCVHCVKTDALLDEYIAGSDTVKRAHSAFPVVRCKHCNRPLTHGERGTGGEWIHKKSRSVPQVYFSCSMYSRIKLKRIPHPPYAEPEEAK